MHDSSDISIFPVFCFILKNFLNYTQTITFSLNLHEEEFDLSTKSKIKSILSMPIKSILNYFYFGKNF